MMAEDDPQLTKMQALLDALEADPDRYGTWPPPKDAPPAEEEAAA